MDLTHAHLLLNHVPTVGFVIGLMLFVSSLIAKNAELKRASLVIFVGIALVTIPTYVSGNAAEEALCAGGAEAPACADPGVSKSLIQTHEDAALLAFAAIILTGAFAWLGLWQIRRTSRAENWNLAVILVLSLVAFGLAARAANIGGEIRHPEIRSAAGNSDAGRAPGAKAGCVRVGVAVWMAVARDAALYRAVIVDRRDPDD